MHGIKVLMAKNYVDNLGEEVQKGMHEKALQGTWPTYGRSVNWRRGWDAFRTLVLVPTGEVRAVLEGIRALRMAA